MLTYPVGYRLFHPNDVLNYQINRWLPGADEREFVEASKVASLPEWERAMLGLGDKAAAEERHLHASTYYRAAEFFMGFDRPGSSRSMAAIASRSRSSTRARLTSASRFRTATAAFRPTSSGRRSAPGHARAPRRLRLLRRRVLVLGTEFSDLGYDVILFRRAWPRRVPP